MRRDCRGVRDDIVEEGIWLYVRPHDKKKLVLFCFVYVRDSGGAANYIPSSDTRQLKNVYSLAHIAV